MKKHTLFLSGLVLLAVALLAPILAVHAADMGGRPAKIVAVATINGSVANEGLMIEAPSLITDMPALRELWTRWAITEPLPEVNFAQQIVVISTTRGSILQQYLTLDAQGNLNVNESTTKDLQPGFRYVIATVNRHGIISVQGTKLPSERRVEPMKLYTGSVEDETLLKQPPHVITDAAVFSALWNGWKIAEAEPVVDFSKQLVLISTTRGSRLGASYLLTHDGHLREMSFATQDLRAGFRYNIAVFNRQGIVKINDQPLPALPGEVRAGIEVQHPTPRQLIESPLTVIGAANTFEGNVIIEIRDGNDKLLAKHVTTAGAGEMKPFSVDIVFTAPTEGDIFGEVIVYAQDGLGEVCYRTVIPVALIAVQ